MKILIAYYSLTGTTAKVAKKIQENLNCEIEEIEDLKDRSGALGYLKSCIDAIRKKPADIKTVEKDPSDYDLVIIGTPIWAGTMANPILTYIEQNKSNFNNVSFFCTCGGSGYEKTLANMENLSGKSPMNTLFMTKNDLESSFDNKIDEFTGSIEK